MNVKIYTTPEYPKSGLFITRELVEWIIKEIEDYRK